MKEVTEPLAEHIR